MLCPFCERILNGSYGHSPVIDVVTFEPLNPVTPGHRLFIPHCHVEHDEGDISDRATSDAMLAAHIYARAKGEAYNLITSSGDLATQTVPHIHVHYVPRREGDMLPLPWTKITQIPAPHLLTPFVRRIFIHRERNLLNRIFFKKTWCVSYRDQYLRRIEPPIKRFDTWQDAMDYANRKGYTT